MSGTRLPIVTARTAEKRVRIHVGADFWRVRVSIPVVGEAEAASDPKHRVAGQKPTAKDLWYFNVGRSRVLNFKQPELYVFSPTRAGWHVPQRFGKLKTD